ncbi:hypothetical protein D0N36_05715 [Hymenobacter lapidiphilus]|uniref:PH domain-containing protein n=1 Tax=Hymenobacter sp. CCM 8763 TaxID=2303334 RepID=UPI000E356F4C|nr:PH domain-containing protein [Hymenobacter sp. CCM 8763]RFP65965.1 hypothetical protein D0N36_05715 [Hymenobacter sp. CCM 8763]
MKQIFRSKISWWLFGPILFLLLFFPLWYWEQTAGHFFTTGINLLVATFFIYLIRTTYYLFHDRQLLVYCGPWRMQIPVDSITQVEATHNPISSPALSLDRLLVRYGKYDSVLISPADRAGFLAALLQLNPAIRHD